MSALKLTKKHNLRYMRNFFILTLVLCAAGVSYAQPPVAWRVDDCMRYAVENAPAARRAELAFDDSRIDKTEAIASFFPRSRIHI